MGIVMMFLRELLICVTVASSAVGADFCLSSISMRACPSPPTIDSIQIQNFVGSYFEMGSTARLKFGSEAGSVCNRVNYSVAVAPSPSSGAVLNLILSALQPLGSQTVSAITQISSSASNICSNARQICSVFASTSRISNALLQISSLASRLVSSHPQQAITLTQTVDNIKQLLSTLQQRVNNLADKVATIQTANAAFTQGSVAASSAANLRAVANDTISEAQAIGGILRGELSMERGKLRSMSANLSQQDMQMLSQALSFIQADVQQMTTHYSTIESLLTQIEGPFASMIEADIGQTNATSSTRGRAIQRASQRGHMDLTIGRSTSPYEIIALDGKAEDGYTAALVYSCKPPLATVGSPAPQEDLLVISRTPQLSSQTLNRFLNVASGYGISTACDNPFINVPQQVAINCGGS